MAGYGFYRFNKIGNWGIGAGYDNLDYEIAYAVLYGAYPLQLGSKVAINVIGALGFGGGFRDEAEIDQGGLHWQTGVELEIFSENAGVVFSILHNRQSFMEREFTFGNRRDITLNYMTFGFGVIF